MNNKLKQFLSASALLTIGSLVLTACGSKVAGTYNLSQMGGPFYGQACPVTMNITESGSNVSASGSANCGTTYTETLSGTESNGVMTVTLLLIPTTGSSGYSSNSQAYTYQGTLTVSGNSVNGVLNATGYAGGGGSITVTGTKN